MDFQSDTLNIHSLRNLTNKQKLIILSLLVAVTAAAFLWFVWIPKNDEIARVERELSNLNSSINIQRVKVRRLPELKKEHRALQRQLAEQKEQLPSEAEIEILLKQVSELGGKSGLDFKLWKPAPKKEDASGLYIEIPVNIEVVGGYHSVGTFFDQISKLKRIINVSDIKMSSPKLQQNQVKIRTVFSATAFASMEKGSAAGAPSKGMVQ
ncbi:MAG: type 4a pilus biogenesis protein PilO [Nitrospiria bacterium]